MTTRRYAAPQARLFEWKKDNTLLRNQEMREWAAARSEAQGGNVLYLDFDHISTTEDAPTGVGSMNWWVLKDSEGGGPYFIVTHHYDEQGCCWGVLCSSPFKAA